MRGGARQDLRAGPATLAHLDANVGVTIDYQTAIMDIADYLNRRSNRWAPLWRLLKTPFKQDNDNGQVIE